VLATKFTLFGIVVKVNQPAQTAISRSAVKTTSYVSSRGTIQG